LAVLRGDRFRGADEPRRGLAEVEPRVWRGDAMIGSRDHAYGRAADLTPAKNTQHRTQRLGCVDQDEGGAELTDEQLDGMYRTFAPKVGGDVADRLMRWYKAVVRGDAA
jgi:hypothetical protein